jgi:uncharacterized repeat protein (TIGR04052 family)
MYPRIAAIFLTASWLGGCGEPPLRVNIPLIAVFDGVPVDCSGSQAVQLTDLRLFLHDVRLKDASGKLQVLSLDPDEAWQQANLAMLDLEDGSGSCDNGTAVVNTVVRGTTAAGDYRGLAFTLGVPFEKNHRDPLLASAPLDDAAMHWHWRGGYKFLRAGVRTINDSFWVHVGSTGCEGTIQNITGCDAPNRVAVRLDDFVPGRDAIVVDLARLIADGELEDGIASDCSSGPSEEACVSAFNALGLSHELGDFAGEQRVFSSQAMP